MAEQKKQAPKNNPKQLEELRASTNEELRAINTNYGKASLANFALRQINRVGPRDINIIFTDKPILKEQLQKIEDIDEIYSKLMLKMGDEKLPEYLSVFQSKMQNVKEILQETIDTFYELKIGNPKKITKWENEKNPTQETETKAAESAKTTTTVKAEKATEAIK